MAHNHNYWIKSENWLPVTENHFQSIKENPEQFGLTSQHIDELCDECGPSSHAGDTDGPGRDSVIREATRNGWVRIRTFNSVETRVVVQGYQVEQHMPSIQDLIDKLRTNGVITDTAAVVISDYATGESRTFRVGPTGVPEGIEGDLELS
jgi:hypothetical protein